MINCGHTWPTGSAWGHTWAKVVRNCHTAFQAVFCPASTTQSPQHSTPRLWRKTGRARRPRGRRHGPGRACSAHGSARDWGAVPRFRPGGDPRPCPRHLLPTSLIPPPKSLRSHELNGTFALHRGPGRESPRKSLKRPTTMAIEGLYEDQENTSSPMVRRRASTRRPLGAINANTIMSPAASASKAYKAEAPAPAAPPPQSPLFSVAPEVSPWTVPDSPVACPLDEKEWAQKRSRGGAMALTALALGAMLAIIAGPSIMPSPAPAMAPSLVESQSGPVVQHSPIEQAVEELVVSYRDDGPAAPADEFDVSHFFAEPAVPVEIASDDAAGFAESWVQEEPAHNIAEEDNEPTEPFVLDDDWAPLSVDDLAAGLEKVTLAPSGPEEEEAVAWEASMMSGPLHIPQMSESDMPEFAGFARLTPEGDLYLFEEADAEFPTGMLAVDGCMGTPEPHGTCFSLHTGVGAFLGCVGDQEEAFDWVHAARQVPCTAH